MEQYYAEHTVDLRRELGGLFPTEEMKALHRRRPAVHFLVTFGLVSTLVGSTVANLLLDRWFFWVPFAIVSGFAIFNFTILLHEVVHRTVFLDQGSVKNRILGICYALPSGISATQFTKWHLDHHVSLGSNEEDPKRHHLSPKINARWYKLLYYSPVLFPIYFRAARRETSTYPKKLQRTIAIERNLTILIHLAVLATLVMTVGWTIAWKIYIVPYFLVFPFAFSLNRLGQHYDINPEDPANWSTLIRGSWFWDVAFLCSNYHLEHHYFPAVPLYNLPRLQRMLLPFFEQRGMKLHSYGDLFWNYIVMNRKPHTNWGESTRPPAAVAASGE